MPHARYMTALGIDEAELRRRRAYFEIADDDLARLRALRPFAEKHTAQITEGLYALILGNEESRRFFADDATIARVKRTQNAYFLGLFEGRCDLAYVQDRLRIGVAHERIGMPQKLYIGAYSRYLRLVLDRIVADLGRTEEALAAYRSAQKLIAFDMALAVDTYALAHAEALERHQAAIRELSTPVIQVHERVLLLPLVGAIDTYRAEQVMETVLERVAGDQAKVLIVDIAGVPIVDTKVAEHLLRTTEAVRLLGAHTILTGISPTIAKTIVNLGVDISAMRTRSRLADGIDLALALLGKAIRGGGEIAEPGSPRTGGAAHG